MLSHRKAAAARRQQTSVRATRDDGAASNCVGGMAWSLGTLSRDLTQFERGSSQTYKTSQQLQSLRRSLPIYINIVYSLFGRGRAAGETS